MSLELPITNGKKLDISELRGVITEIDKEERENTGEKKFSAEMTKRAFEALCDAFKSVGAEEFGNIQELYNKIPNKTLVRREDPKKLFDLIVDKKDINLDFDQKIVGDKGDAYANCAEYMGGKGLVNAFNEGWSHLGGVTMVMGFGNGSDYTVEVPEDSTVKIGDLDRQYVRIVKGTIHDKNVKFVVIRAPQKFVDPVSTNLEKKKFVFRGYLFNNTN